MRVDEGVGTTLREARNRRKVDLSKVEAATKIRVRYLRAIENEEWDLLPGEAYARGFLRTYAAYLGLDAERLVEQRRRGGGAAIPSERLPRAEPAPVAARRARRGLPSPPPRLLAVMVSAALIAILVAIGLSSGGSPSPGPSSRRDRHPRGREGGANPGLPQRMKKLSLRLTATAEVWVCLVGHGGKPLLDGQILAGGEEAGPFRSGSFTLAMGNGAIEITVDGRRVSIPPSSGPVGYSIDHGGGLREIAAGERPTCT
jgi:helix-turn-helix protein/uncharacterized protein DUF4115